jgi:hypothetical protein
MAKKVKAPLSWAEKEEKTVIGCFAGHFETIERENRAMENRPKRR